MNYDNWTHVGAHRGGGLVARALTNHHGQVHVIDPDAKNAHEVVELHRSRGRSPRFTNARVEEVRDVIDAEETVVLTPDSLSAIRSTVGDPRLRGHVEAQGLLRGTSSAGHNLPIGLQLSLPKGRDDLRQDAVELLNAFERVAPPASSSAMATSFLADRRMNRARSVVSQTTALHLMDDPERVRDRSHAAELFLMDVAYPLVLAHERPKVALLREAIQDLERRSRTAVAFIGPAGIDLVFVTVSWEGRARIDAHVPLDRPHVPERERNVERTSAPSTPVVRPSQSAFTD